ncbi:maternal protein tudor-like isoform X1 [Bombus pyrosoma]|uniref:maternal protein tudor-like isoform X1 n=1 Tax=Bombus pyrosoma TaxID=396416 RepID=UPI001CB976B4|nr:maternal protein tudor-like isoform X1 [Bombus pyrosoma]XP_043597592.1 maternal protein tudor-like isoform X1 [Bombus pyrosoma]XP_043597674.1 maternal protein tudor-like isoform X1 [Bombus pyrosoma]XP_043597757.1 maternal protein tudor-like isoform X1 [Bombus pyrosoma]XP_043597820.1 maternal protein tudor-like isoform X1 [Bombus pyrosoma]
MSIKQNSELIIFVTHIEPCHTFLRIWGQIDKNSGTCVERMILPLVEQFTRRQTCVKTESTSLRINALCCAKFQNDGYYRARIKHINNIDNTVLLHFIDYGNLELFSIQEIHLLDDIPGTEPLRSFPPVAFQFTLMNLLPANGHWSNEVIESIQKTLMYNEYKIMIRTITNSDNFIKLVYNNEDFSELLIKRNVAKRATLLEMYSSRGITDPELLLYEKDLNSLNSAENEVEEFQQNVCSCCAAQKKHTMHASVQEALVFKSRVLDVSSKYDVYVSFVEDGPYKFSVQLQSTTQILRALMRDINSHPLEPLQEPPLPGSVCLGRYTRDKVLCRAVVMSVMENKCKLYYVDFGHTEVLPYTDIFKLPPHFINPRVLSIRFTLSGVHELNVTGTMKEYFKQVLAGKLLVLHVCPPEGPPLIQYGDLYVNGKNIKDILREAFPPPVMLTTINCFTYQTPKPLLVEDVVNVYVSFVESYKKFFVRLEDYVPSLELIMNDLANFCTSAPTLSLAELKVGLPCAALYDDQWYRAQIESINGEKVRVLYVDYGNEETVTLKSLRSIRADLVKTLPAQAIKCTLHGYRVIEPTQETHNRFESYTLEKRFHIKVVDVTSNGLVVDLYEKEHNMNIISELFHIVPVEHVKNQYSFKLILKTDGNEDISKWHKKNQSISLHQTHNSSTDQEKNKIKILKNESSNNFHHNDSQNEKFNRDESSNNHSTKDKWSNSNGARHDGNDSSKIGKGTRGNRNKDSDTSFKSNTKHGKSSTNRGSCSRRGDISERMQSNKCSDRNNDGNYKSGKTNGDHDSNKFKERKGQGYRLVQNKLNIVNYTNDEKRQNSMKHTNEVYIPRHLITIGVIKSSEVVVVNSLCNFFLQINSDYIALETMMENIQLIYQNGGGLLEKSDIVQGTYCIAQYSKDLKWYRAVIKFIKENSATVQFIDYGNMETVTFDKMKPIKKEFLKLPIQAIHCKLFGVKDDNFKSNNIKAFENLVINKAVEAEFIGEENGMYSVLLRRMSDNGQTEIFINREFCEDTKQENITKWTTIPYAPETKKDVIITWFTNPNNFYCQILDNENEFKFMMNEIQRIYVTKKPISYMLQVGSPVVAIFSDDGAFYRAEIIELNKSNGHLIQYIDFGNSAIVHPQNIYPVEKELMRLPKQAVQCSLLNVAPLDGVDWSEANTKEIDNCFNVDNCTCVFHDKKDDKYLISLINNGNDVAKMLAKLNLASLSNSGTESDVDVIDNNTLTPIIKSNIRRVDINLLNGQALRVKVSSVQNISEFYVQLPSATECEDIINTYMAEKNLEVMQRLSSHEICPGTGCLVYSNGVWRRAVISSHSQSTGFNVKFIDTGAYHEILSDSVLALPGELSVMQYQSIKCSLIKNIISETDTRFKEMIEGREVIISVEEIDNNRLIVKLFDLNGCKIKILERSDEKLLPICPLPILCSTQEVIVAHVNHSGSIWLKCTENYEMEKSLLRALNKYYPISGKIIRPKVGRLCAVRSSNGQWYRAKIISHSEKGVCINYLDFGTSVCVPHNRVMVLDSQFYTPYQLAINVSLSVIIKGTVFEQSDILEHHLVKKLLTCVFYNVDKRWVVELLHNGEKFSSKFRSLNLTSEQKIYGIRESGIYNMAEGCKYKVSVAHADSPSQFWLHYADDIVDFHSKHMQLQHDALTFPEVDGVLEEGSLCIVLNTISNYWFRAQVLDADEDITTVRFIDHGNTDTINNKSGKIRQLSDEWKEIKGYAIKCRLDVIPAETEDWNSAICKKFESLVKIDGPVEAMVIANSVPKRVDLLINGKSVSEMLVEDHHAVKIHTEEELIDEIVDVELDPYSAFVSHINSPNEFWVQEEKSVGNLEIMTDRFLVAHMFPKVDEIKENLLCVAKYPEDDCWYRARVVSHSDSATRVIYIDYGNSATSTEIRAIPPDLADIPPLSRKCRLIMPEGITKWSEKACKEFVTLAADGATIFLLDVIDEGETSSVKLTLDGKNVTDMLANFCERQSSIIENRLSPLGEENLPNVFVSCINSPDEFWIQAESNTTDLNTMLEKLQAAPSFLLLSIFDIGTICAARYLENGQWRRAKILSHSEKGTEVLCIDYGNIMITNETRMLPADIINIPPLSKCCSLQKPNSINSWPLDACKIFEELAAGGKTMFQFEILDDISNRPSVKLSFNGKNIADILVPFVQNISEDAIIKGVNETNKGDDVDINRLPENSESQNQEIEENTDNSCLNTNYDVELTVDDIVRNMEVDKDVLDKREDEDEEIDKITENLEHLKTQAEIETCSDKNEMQDIKIHAEVKTVSEEVLSSTIQNVTLNTISDSSDIKSGLEDVKKEQDNVIISKSQICNTEMEISEPNINIQCSESVKDENTSNLKEFVREQSVETPGETTRKDTSISVLKEETNILSIDETKRSSNKDCYTRDTDEVNVNIMGSKGCSDVSNRQNDEPLIDVTVSEKITDSQDDDPKISE